MALYDIDYTDKTPFTYFGDIVLGINQPWKFRFADDDSITSSDNDNNESDNDSSDDDLCSSPINHRGTPVTNGRQMTLARQYYRLVRGAVVAPEPQQKQERRVMSIRPRRMQPLKLPSWTDCCDSWKYHPVSPPPVEGRLRSNNKIKEAKLRVAQVIDHVLSSKTEDELQRHSPQLLELNRILNSETMLRLKQYLTHLRQSISSDEYWADDRIEMALAFYRQHEDIGYVRDAVEFINSIGQSSLCK
jgi:hypothetical protein